MNVVFSHTYLHCHFFFLNVFTSATLRCPLNQFYCFVVEFVDWIPVCRKKWDNLVRNAFIALSNHGKDVSRMLHAVYWCNLSFWIGTYNLEKQCYRPYVECGLLDSDSVWSCSSETSVTTYKVTRSYNPLLHCRKNLRSQREYMIWMINWEGCEWKRSYSPLWETETSQEAQTFFVL